MNVLLVLLAFWLPGLLFGAAIRLRGWTLAAAGPMLTFGLVALGIPVLGKLGIRWSMLDVALWTLVVSAAGAALAFAVTRFTRRRHPDWTEPERPERSVRDHVLIGLGVAAGLGIGAVTFLRGVRNLNNVQQGWDAPFHANLVRWIAEHGDARPSTVGTIANLPNQTNYFYPDTYHALLALVFGKGGLAMMPTLNLAALTVVLTVPIGVAAMCHAWRMPPVAVASAAAVSACFSVFPYDSLWRGPLWPFVAGVALVPAMLAVARHLLEPRAIAGPVGIGVGVAGLAGLHTSVVFVVIVYFLLILAAVLLKFEQITWRRSLPSLVATFVLAAAFGIPVVLPSLYNAGGVTSTYWASEATVSGAVGETITFSPMAPFPQWWIGIPAIIGVFMLVRHRRMMWMVGAYIALGALFAATVSLETDIVHLLSSPFYNDNWRVAALVPLAGCVAFGEFVHTASGWFAEKVRPRLPNLRPATLTLVGVVLIALVVGGLSRGGYIGRNAARVQYAYNDSPTISKDEEAAFGWLAAHTKPGERVLNDRIDGSVWMYALAGVMPTQWSFYGSDRGTNTDEQYLSVFADDLDKYPRVRKALTDLKVRYAFVGTGKVIADRPNDVGLQHLDVAPGFKLVFRNAGASIYEIEGQEGVVTSGATPGSTAGNGK